MRYLALAAAVVATVALAARPTSINEARLALDGSGARYMLVDGGVSLLSGNACAELPPWAKGIRVIPSTPVNICIMPQPNGIVWDGGCNNTWYDLNFGEPVQPFQSKTWFPATTATTICQATDAGLAFTPVWAIP